MTTNLETEVELRASRGEPRGAAEVWAAGVAEATRHGRPVGRGRTALWLAVVALGLVAAAIVLQPFRSSDDVPVASATDPDAPSDAETEHASPPAAHNDAAPAHDIDASQAPPGLPDLAEIGRPAAGEAARLDAAYVDCARSAGVPLDFAQVLVELPSNTPVLVKTDRDVPAAVHGPCLVQIGGTDRGVSSHGNPAAP